MVLADRGLVCIDEFDKMNDNDRVAIHEAQLLFTTELLIAAVLALVHARTQIFFRSRAGRVQIVGFRRSAVLPDGCLMRLTSKVLDRARGARPHVSVRGTIWRSW